LNLYILVAAFLEIFGELIDSTLLRMLKPVPMLLMVAYVHGKNNNRKHLVPSLVEVALLISLVVDLISITTDDSNAIIVSIKIIVHLVYCVSLSFGDSVRLLL
jgi:hypothetical protein